jgi:hypothetical protein
MVIYTDSHLTYLSLSLQCGVRSYQQGYLISENKERSTSKKTYHGDEGLFSSNKQTNNNNKTILTKEEVIKLQMELLILGLPK